MAEITLSPIPYGSGGLIPGERRHFCRITDAKFFGIYAQTNPDYTFGMIFNIDNIRAASPAVSQGRVQSIPILNGNDSYLSFRVARLNDTDILVLRQDGYTTCKLNVIRLAPGTDEMTVVGNTISVSIASGGQLKDSISQTTGFEEIADNIVMLITVPSTGYKVIDRISWNTSTDTLSLSNAVPAFQTKYITLTKVRDSQKWAFAATNNYTQLAQNGAVLYWGVGDPANNSTAWSYITKAPYSGPSIVMLPTTDTTALRPRTRNKWDVFSGGTRTLSDIGFGGTTSPAPIITYAQWVSSDFFIFLSSAETSNQITTLSSNLGYLVRVVRYTDDTYGDTSAATQTDVKIFDTGFIFDYGTVGTFKHVANDLILAFGRASADGAFKLGIISPNSA